MHNHFAKLTRLVARATRVPDAPTATRLRLLFSQTAGLRAVPAIDIETATGDAANIDDDALVSLCPR